jgi:hypothetical protein
VGTAAPGCPPGKARLALSISHAGAAEIRFADSQGRLPHILNKNGQRRKTLAKHNFYRPLE